MYYFYYKKVVEDKPIVGRKRGVVFLEPPISIADIYPTNQQDLWRIYLTDILLFFFLLQHYIYNKFQQRTKNTKINK